MVEPAGNISNWQQRLIAELKRDKKKAVIMGVLLAIGLIVVGKQMIKGMGPSRATAVPAPSTAQLPQHSPRDQTTSPSISPEQLGQPDEVRSLVKLDRTIERDIFGVQLDMFPLKDSEALKNRGENTSTESSGQRMIRNVITEAQTLMLQSTIVCDDSTAVINEEVLRIGQSVGGFTVVKIRARSCDVVKNDVLVTLTMKE